MIVYVSVNICSSNRQQCQPVSCNFACLGICGLGLGVDTRQVFTYKNSQDCKIAVTLHNTVFVRHAARTPTCIFSAVRLRTLQQPTAYTRPTTCYLILYVLATSTSSRPSTCARLLLLLVLHVAAADGGLVVCMHCMSYCLYFHQHHCRLTSNIQYKPYAQVCIKFKLFICFAEHRITCIINLQVGAILHMFAQ